MSALPVATHAAPHFLAAHDHMPAIAVTPFGVQVADTHLPAAELVEMVAYLHEVLDAPVFVGGAP